MAEPEQSKNEPTLRAPHKDARQQSKLAWALAGGALLFLAALALWMNKLQEQAAVEPAQEKTSKRSPDPDGGDKPGAPLPVAFGDERCRPWHVSAVSARPGQGFRVLVLTSSVADPYGLVGGGFVEACGDRSPSLVAEKLADGQLAAKVDSLKPDALVLVGSAAAERAAREAADVPWLYALVPDPQARGLDVPGKTGVLPWVPMTATVGHVLRPLPRSKSEIAVIHTPAMAELAAQAAQAIKADGRKAAVLPLESAAGVDALLDQAAEKGQAWFVIPDRKIIDHEVYNRIQVAAEYKKIPLLVTDEEHVRAGAYAGVGPDSFRIGAQLCHLAGALQRGELPPGSQVFCPEYSFSAVHQATVEKLGYILDPKQLRQAKLYKWH